MTKAEYVARRIEAEAYEGTSANTDWDSNFDVKEGRRNHRGGVRAQSPKG